MEYGTGVTSDSDNKSAGDDVTVTSKTRLEVSGGVTLASDSLSSTSSSPSGRRHPGGQTTVRHERQSEPSVETSLSSADKVLDMSVESDVPHNVGCFIQTESSRSDNFEEAQRNDDDVGDASFDCKVAVDLSTSKTLSTIDIGPQNSLEQGCRAASEKDLDDDFPDTSRQQRSSLLQSKLVFSQPMSPVHN